MCFFEETQSGSNRDLVGTQSGTNFRVFGTTFGPVGKMATQKRAKTIKNTAKSCFLWIWLPPDIGARLYADWIPTGQKRCPKMQKLVPDWVPTGSRQNPDSIHRSARTHSRTYFSLPRPTLAPIFFSAHQPCTNTPPLLHQNGKSSLKPNGGSTM